MCETQGDVSNMILRPVQARSCLISKHTYCKCAYRRRQTQCDVTQTSFCHIYACNFHKAQIKFQNFLLVMARVLVVISFKVGQSKNCVIKYVTRNFMLVIKTLLMFLRIFSL
jgi:hypothetical protein